MEIINSEGTPICISEDAIGQLMNAHVRDERSAIVKDVNGVEHFIVMADNFVKRRP